LSVTVIASTALDLTFQQGYPLESFRDPARVKHAVLLSWNRKQRENKSIKQTNKQTSKQTSKQINKQTNKNEQ